jgi:hypothetical protein
VYTLTRISGQDLFDQERNPDYPFDDTEDADSALDNEDELENGDSDARMYHTETREFGRSGWYPGFHATAGINIMVKYDLALVLALRYEYLPIETVEIEMVSDGPNEWHWKDRTLKGDAGEFAGSFGIAYIF